MSLLQRLFGSKSDISGSSHEAEGVLGVVSKLFDKNEKEVAKLRPLVDQINAFTEEIKALSDEELKARSFALRERFFEELAQRLEAQGFELLPFVTQFGWTDAYVRARNKAEKEVLDLLLPEAFALVRESGDRTIGLRHFDVQLLGGMVLHGGKIAEMRTGEGKTLVATLPAYLNSLTGRGVHCVTVNDYLAERDANWMRPIYEFLGLSVGFLQNDMDAEERQEVYASDVVYGTNSEFGFDYLRDNMARLPGDLVQRPVNFAIIDEVDNILIDEARTPLIISAQVAKTDRALRRQGMSKTCDGVAKILMPAVTDREVETFIEGFSTKKQVDIAGLTEAILARGAFTQAMGYLISAYLQSEESARLSNAARLLDASDELSKDKLISDAGKTKLDTVALAAVDAKHLHEAWREEIGRLLAPFETAWLNAQDSEWNAALLAHDLTLPEDAAIDLEGQISDSDDKARTVTLLIVDEMSNRELVDSESVEAVASALQSGHDAFVLACLEQSGNLAAADKVLRDNAPETASDAASVRKLVAALETVTQNGLLPFESLEVLWNTAKLPLTREQLRAEIIRTVEANGGEVATKISELTKEYSVGRTTFLAAQSAKLEAALAPHKAVAKLALNGEDAPALQNALQKELGKSGQFAQAVKAASVLQKEQTKTYEQIAAHMIEEMAQWVEEMPREANKVFVSLLAEGGRQHAVADRLVAVVRDLPGDGGELSAIATDGAARLQTWRQEQAVAFTDKVNALVPLPEEARTAIQRAVEDGEFGAAGFDTFVGAQLTTSPAIAPLASAVEEYGGAWNEFKRESNAKLIEQIEKALEISGDAHDALGDLLAQPLSGALDHAIFGALAADVVARHLEPLLTEENARAFTEEIKRRLILPKDLAKNLPPSEFVGKSADQLARALRRLANVSVSATPPGTMAPEQYLVRVAKNLGWMAEKDEKRRTAALTDMGTLVAEREAANPAFSDPENFLETLLQADILTEEEAVLAQRAGAEAGTDESLTATIDRVLRLPAERRRRLAEAKLQEVQPILDQAVKAHALFEYNVNYVIGREESGKQGIVIVDEFTGRTMPGRRFSEGLHEALEAKHDLEVQIESQTVATITIQNYFRLYNKISGLTGTAKTEETEFAKTYGMEVVTVPTNKQVRRKDAPDVVYKTAEAKWRAISFDVLEHHCAGQPVLVGTRSVEMSEQMARRLSAASLQTLVLAHLIKERLNGDKTVPEADKAQLIGFLRGPILGINPVQVKGLAKQLGLNPDPTASENLDAMLAAFTLGTPDRELLTTALKQGLPHNVLNAKNHRNEARIIAEAARPGAVTIATNMAGRGVDIILGGSLDGESRWRVITMQTLARQVEGKGVHVRSRNGEATQKMVSRLTPEALQMLAWATTLSKAVDAMERDKALTGQAAKEIRDALGSDLTAPDFANRVRSRARRFNLLDKLPIDAAPTSTEILPAFTKQLSELMGRDYDVAAVAAQLESGLPAQDFGSETAGGNDMGRTGEQLAMMMALAQPLAFSAQACERLLEVLPKLPDLDRQLLELIVSGAGLKPETLAANLEVVTPAWVQARLAELNVPNSDAARDRLGDLETDTIETNEWAIARAMGALFQRQLREASPELTGEELAAQGTGFPGAAWLRARLSEWGVVANASPFEGTEEMQMALQDQMNVHLRLNPKMVGLKIKGWALPERRREFIAAEMPNLVLLGEMTQMMGPQPFLEPQWLHAELTSLELIGENDAFQAQMMAQVQDENGVESVQQIDVVVYRTTLARMLEAIKPVVQSAAREFGHEPEQVFGALQNVAPWVAHFTDEKWLASVVGEAPALTVAAPEATAELALAEDFGIVRIETGVAGQSADIVLESEARPEDIAHTSERDEVTGHGGLHIIGTERHESRRIDNQLRGRAGRQGDPGTSRFYISLDDELWRLFGARGGFLLGGWDEDEPVEAKMITASIARAQKKVELNHFEGRKQTLQYDDVMNVQREVIYRERRRALQGEDIRDTVLDMAGKAALAEAQKHCPRAVRPDEWDTHKLWIGLGRLFGLAAVRAQLKEDDLEGATWVERPGATLGAEEYDFVLEGGTTLSEVVEKLYEERENTVGTDQVRGLERWQVMKSIDSHWTEHLAEMDYLRDAIWQQGYAQKEPIGVYRQEGFALFQKMLGEIRREVTERIFAYDLPDFENEDPTLEYADMEEGRLLQMLPYDDGVDDGVQLDTTADGEGESNIQVHPAATINRESLNRAQRRSQGKN